MSKPPNTRSAKSPEPKQTGFAERPPDELSRLDLRGVSRLMETEAALQKPLVFSVGKFLDDEVERSKPIEAQATPESQANPANPPTSPASPAKPRSVFTGRKLTRPASEILEYICRRLKLNHCCAVAVMLYLERAKTKGENLTPDTIRHLLLVATLVAAKYIEATQISNKQWSIIGGLPIKELNALEVEFLKILNYDVSVPTEDYDRLVRSLGTFPQAPPRRALGDGGGGQKAILLVDSPEEGHGGFPGRQEVIALVDSPEKGHGGYPGRQRDISLLDRPEKDPPDGGFPGRQRVIEIVDSPNERPSGGFPGRQRPIEIVDSPDVRRPRTKRRVGK